MNLGKTPSLQKLPILDAVSLYYKTLFWSRFQTVFLNSVRQYSYWKSVMVKALQAVVLLYMESDRWAPHRGVYLTKQLQKPAYN